MDWKLVPTRLTQNMANAAKCVDARLSVWKYDDAYQAMLTNAPEPPETSAQTVAQLQARVAELEAALADESEKAAFWASKAHEMRGQALRGEPVDGIIQP